MMKMKKDKKLRVLTYSLNELRNLFELHSVAPVAKVKAKRHLEYFDGYFGSQGMKAKTIVVEPEYVDADYLDDYAGYYVRCFHSYGRYCSRLHFFANEFDRDDFESVLANASNAPLDAEQLKKHYLGFIVVRPLPETFIGRTCLKHYPDKGTNRNFATTRKYDVCLFGLELVVTTLAFQEQDSVAAACATSALWSTFHATGKMWQHEIPSPVEITQRADKVLPQVVRALPSEGLTLQQMALAIKSIGLEPIPTKTECVHELKDTVYAYLKMGIPCPLLGELWDCSGPAPRSLGGHAVAVTGYHLAPVPAPAPTALDLPTTAARIDKIYVHDDQIGPFARMEIESGPLPVNSEPGVVLSTQWQDPNGGTGNIKLIAQLLLIPLYHKIRIQFDSVWIKATKIHKLFYLLGFMFGGTNHLGVEWDIHLSEIKRFKKEVLFQTPQLTGPYRRSIVEHFFPRFVWRIKAVRNNEPLIEFLFDATGIKKGNYFLGFIVHDLNTATFLEKGVDKSYKYLSQHRKLASIMDLIEHLRKHKDVIYPPFEN